MLKVKLNLKEVQKSDFIIINELQNNNGMIVFPFYDKNGVVQFIELHEDNGYYQLSFKEGKNSDEVITDVKELEKNTWCEALEKFLEFNNNIIEKYEERSLMITLDFLMDYDGYKYYTTDINTAKDKMILRVETLSTLALVYEVDVNSYGTVYGEGYIVDRELDKKISGNKVTFVFDKGVDITDDVTSVAQIIENIDEDYLIERIRAGLMEGDK